jgi:hypothetical protein
MGWAIVDPAAAKRLQLAIRGGLAADVVDRGAFGQSLEALARLVADRLTELCNG